MEQRPGGGEPRRLRGIHPALGPGRVFVWVTRLAPSAVSTQINPASSGETASRRPVSAPRRPLTVRRSRAGPVRPGAPALAHEIIEARHPPIQSSHCFRCAFTHRHHHCAASSLRHSSRSRQGEELPACAFIPRGLEMLGRQGRTEPLRGYRGTFKLHIKI